MLTTAEPLWSNHNGPAPPRPPTSCWLIGVLLVAPGRIECDGGLWRGGQWQGAVVNKQASSGSS